MMRQSYEVYSEGQKTKKTANLFRNNLVDLGLYTIFCTFAGKLNAKIINSFMNLDKIDDIIIKTTKQRTWKTAYVYGRYMSYKPKYHTAHYRNPISAFKEVQRFLAQDNYSWEKPMLILKIMGNGEFYEEANIDVVKTILIRLIWEYRDNYDFQNDRIFDIEITRTHTELINQDENERPIFKTEFSDIYAAQGLTDEELYDIARKYYDTRNMTKVTYHGKQGNEVIHLHNYDKLYPTRKRLNIIFE